MKTSVCENENHKYDLVICGGGLAGVCAALSASRLGLKTALIGDRPVLGGNSSSEVRVALAGTANAHAWARESGIIEELILTERAQNFTIRRESQVNSVWDLVLYDKCRREPLLKLYLNASIRCVTRKAKRIEEVAVMQLGNEKQFSVKGNLFVDATGDGTVAFMAGAEHRMGREGRKAFGEELAPGKPDKVVMGSSLLFQVRDIGKPVAFSPPAWAVKYAADNPVLKTREHDRIPGLWWVEIGPPYNTISDNEPIKDELIRHLLGVWDHMKNQGDHGCANFALDWIGQVPGKRESRRIIGDYILNENDIRQGKIFPDAVAYGGYYFDLHTPGGILAGNKPPEATYGDQRAYDQRGAPVYSIPLRCLYAKDIENLFMAGRDISVSHVALGSVRLMATCAIMGQAVGTCAYLCKRHHLLPRQAGSARICDLQQQLLKDDCFIPGVVNTDPHDLARHATVEATSSSALVFPPPAVARRLDKPLGELFPVSGNKIATIGVFLETQKKTEVVLRLRRARSVWDFGPENDLAAARVTLAAGTGQWVTFPLGVNLQPRGFYWIALDANPAVLVYGHNHLRLTSEIPRHKPVPVYDKNLFLPAGTVPLHKPYAKWFYMRDIWAMSLRMEPAQYPYQPQNVLSGVARPEYWTNIWISNPPLPQALTLNFEKTIGFNSIYLTFDTSLKLTQNMGLPPLDVPAETARDYRLYYHGAGQWRELGVFRDNHLRRRIHRWNKRIKADKIKLEILSTWGSPRASLYEIRVYNEAQSNVRK